MRSGLTYGESSTGNLPNITGNTGGCVSNGTPRGCFYQSTQVSTAGGGSGRFYENGFNVSRSSSIYGRYNNVDKVLPSFITMHYVIKY